ncbi:MAG: hypothetical protein MJ213_02320 [Bacilli bacterium]|nr:hypothetical protein [Bacilli bacterium]
MGKRSKFVALTFFCLSAAALAGCSGGGGGGGHKFEEHPAVAATCTTPGNKLYYTCSEEACKDKIFDENKKETTVEAITIAALGHDYDYEHKTVSWTAEGAHAEAKCTRCDAKDEETVSEEPNFYYVKDSDATCTEKEKGHWHAKFKNTKFGEADSEQVEVGPEPEGHDYGDLVPEVVRWRDTDGVAAHYYCDKCECYFDENRNEVDYEDLLDPSTLETFEENTDYTHEFENPISVTDTIVVDINIDRSSEKWIKFALFDDWSNYTKYITLINGTIEEDMTGVEIYNLEEDGYSRIVLHPSEMPTQEGTLGSVKFLYLRGALSNVGGTIEYNPVKGSRIRGLEFTASPNWPAIEGEAPLDELLYVDFKFKNPTADSKISFRLNEDWDAGGYSGTVTLKSDGTLSGMYKGVTVEKVQDAEGYVNGYYRLTIDPQYIGSWETSRNFTDHISRVVISASTNCAGYCAYNNTGGIDVVTPTELNFTTGEIHFSFTNVLTIKSGSQLLENKAINFKVNGSGTGYAQFSLMDGAWSNCGDLKITYESGVVTSAYTMYAGGGSATVTSLGDGLYNIQLPLTALNGGQVGAAEEIAQFYVGNGICKEGLTSIGIDFGSISLVDITPGA